MPEKALITGITGQDGSYLTEFLLARGYEAAWGIPPDRFYSAVAAVSGLSPLFRVELVDPGACRPGLRQTLEDEGIEL